MWLLNRIELIIALLILTILSVKLWKFLQRKKKLKKMAEILNLNFSELPLDKGQEFDLSDMKNRKWAARLQKVFSLFAPWEITGTLRGLPVRISTRHRAYRVRRVGTSTSTGKGKEKEVFMRMEICFVENLDLGLQIFSDNPFVKEGYDGYDDRRKDLQSGNPELDERVKILGISEQRITKLLGRTDLLEALLQLFKRYSNAVVDDESVRIEERGIIVDADDCRARLESLVSVASSMERAVRFV